MSDEYNKEAYEHSLWPSFVEYLVEHCRWRSVNDFDQREAYWIPLWQAFLAGSEAEVKLFNESMDLLGEDN